MTRVRVAIENAAVVFWDFDGVIKESVHVKSDAFHALFLPHGREIADRVRTHHLEHGGMSRLAKIPLYLSWCGLEPHAELVNEYCARFAQMVEEAVIDAEWVPGVRAVLGTRSDFVLVSATPQEEIERILRRLKIRQAFARVYGAPTEKAFGIRRTLQELAVHPSSALMLGDSREDWTAAQSCGIPFLFRRNPTSGAGMQDYEGPEFLTFE